MSAFILLSIVIASLLAIASIFIRYQVLQNPSAERIKNKQRLFVWWIIFALCLVIFKLGAIAVLLSICCLFIWLCQEITSLFERQFNRYIILMCCSIFTILLLIICYPEQTTFVLVVAIVGAFLVYFMPIKHSLYVPILFLYCCFSLCSILLVLRLAQQASLDYSYLLLVLFFVISVNDIAQYIVGSIFGKTPIAPSLSPNKTVAGLWGGILISSVFCVLLLPALLSISKIEAFIIGSLLALAGFLGDLIISKLKRGLQVKDSGSSIIGHGGILDRIDSLLLTVPIFGVLLRLKGYL